MKHLQGIFLIKYLWKNGYDKQEIFKKLKVNNLK